MKQFVAVLLLARDLAHQAHWATKSYAQHMALDGFYNDVIGLTDELVEMYQGRHGLLGPIDLIDDKLTDDPAAMLQGYLDWLEKNRYKVIDKSDTAIQNKIDEIVGLFLTTLYKLKNLC